MYDYFPLSLSLFLSFCNALSVIFTIPLCLPSCLRFFYNLSLSPDFLSFFFILSFTLSLPSICLYHSLPILFLSFLIHTLSFLSLSFSHSLSLALSPSCSLFLSFSPSPSLWAQQSLLAQHLPGTCFIHGCMYRVANLNPQPSDCQFSK